jgi:predicted porin
MKKILAVAIATAFAAPAFAATSNVDVYGSMNLSVENVDNGATDWNRMVTNNNSFIGFKGSEDLGGGMKAVWQIEANLEISGNGAADGAANTGTDGNIYGTRNTFVGLAGGFGTVLAGVHDTPYKMSTGPLDIFVGTLGDYNGVFGAAGAGGGNPSALFDLRTGNTIAYVSPKFGGFDVKAAYVMGLEAAEDAVATTDVSSAWSLSGTYANGPLFATAAYEKHNSVAGAATAGVCITGATCLTEGTLDRDAWKIGVGYTIGDFKVGAIYESIDGDTGTAIGHDSWGLNGAYSMGAITLKASYAKAGEVDDAAGAEAANTGADMWAVGVDYALSKRTLVQLTYATMDNDTAGGWDLGQGPQVSNAVLGSEVSGFSLGVKHTF